MTIHRFAIWGRGGRPVGVVRHGLCVEIEAETYEAARVVLVEHYADGLALRAGSKDTWENGGAETVVVLQHHQLHDPSGPTAS